MILKQGHKYEPMPHDGKLIAYIYRGGRCYYEDSPYSLAATQALKAAFPQYWTAIRDYGVAHPQLVPFINEDPMLIVSLVEVGKTRWLVGDGKAYCMTDFYPEPTDLVLAKYIPYDISFTQTPYGCRKKSTTGASAYNDFLINNGQIRVDWASNQNNLYINTQIKNGEEYEIEERKGYIKVNDTVYQYSVSGEKSAFPMCVFALNNGGEIIYPSKIKLSYLICSNIIHLLPFTRNGENGMLDILSGTFHPNANTQGAFTIQVTDKA